MIDTIPITEANWFPIYANYPYDKNLNIPKHFFRWFDGYSGYEQSIFKSGLDMSINKDTIFYLPNISKLSDFIKETNNKKLSLGSYITISTYTGPHFNYKRMYISKGPNGILLLKENQDKTSLFRFVINNNNTFSLISESNLYVTVENNSPFNLYLSEKIPSKEKYNQQFIWREKDGKIYFIAKINDSHEYYWSFSKAGPKKGYMRACGMAPSNIYLNNADLYTNIYLFDVEGYIVNFDEAGATYDHSWISYFNEFYNKKYNKTVDDNIIINKIPINHLIDTPYNTKIDIESRTMNINILNLKNTLSRKYEDVFKNLSHYNLSTAVSTVTTLYDEESCSI